MKKNLCLFFIFAILLTSCNNQAPSKKNSPNSFVNEAVEALSTDNSSKGEEVDISSADNSLNLQNHNTIDDFFNMMAMKIVPTTTYEMLMFETLISEAWKSEMLNCYEVIKSKTTGNKIHELLNSERDSYIKYIKNKAEIDIYYSSGVFDGGDVMLGSLHNVDKVCILSDGYKEKTIELMERLKDIGNEPTFIFDKDKFYAKLKEEFFEAHPNAF